MTAIRLSFDSFARAQAVESVELELVKQGITVERTGSYGLAWAEPVLELATPESQIALGGITTDVLPDLIPLLKAPNQLKSGALNLEIEALGKIEEHSYLQPQQRLVFDRVGRCTPLTLPDPTFLAKIIARDPNDLIEDIRKSGLRGRGGAGLWV